VRDFFKLMMMEVYYLIEEGAEEPGGGSGSAPIQVNMGDNVIELPANTDLTDPFKTEEKPLEEPTGPTVTEEMLTDIPPGIAKTILGKSFKDILAGYVAKETQIGKLGTKLGQQQQQLLSDGKRTTQTVSDELKPLTDQMADKQKELEELDELVDEEDYKKVSSSIEKLKAKTKKLENELGDLKITEQIDQRLNAQYNDGAFEKMRGSLQKDFNLQFEDTNWQMLMDRAKEINGPGQITAESMEGAVMEGIGVDKYRSILTNQGEMNMREKLSTASGMTLPLIQGGGDKGKQALDFNSLPKQVQNKIINSMEGKQFFEYMRKETGVDWTKFIS